MPISIRYGDKKRALSQQLDISHRFSKEILHSQASHTNRRRVWGVMRIDIDNVGHTDKVIGVGVVDM